MDSVINTIKTGKNIKKYMDVCGLSVKDVQKALNLASVQAVYYWINGRNIPSLENMYVLSELFMVPIDSIVVGNRKSYFKNSNPQYQRLYTYYKRLRSSAR